MIEELKEAFAHACITLKQCAPERIPFMQGFIDWLLDEYNDTKPTQPSVYQEFLDERR